MDVDFGDQLNLNKENLMIYYLFDHRIISSTIFDKDSKYDSEFDTLKYDNTNDYRNFFLIQVSNSRNKQRMIIEQGNQIATMYIKNMWQKKTTSKNGKNRKRQSRRFCLNHYRINERQNSYKRKLSKENKYV